WRPEDIRTRVVTTTGIKRERRVVELRRLDRDRVDGLLRLHSASRGELPQVQHLRLTALLLALRQGLVAGDADRVEAGREGREVVSERLEVSSQRGGSVGLADQDGSAACDERPVRLQLTLG